MKPINLKMCAFGPFPKEVEIPFNKVAENGLFLISGETGAGKTTVFDGICYALFGKVSGSFRDVNTAKSDFAKDKDVPYVELLFSHKGREMTIYRQPKYKQMNKGEEKEILKKSVVYIIENDIQIYSGREVEVFLKDFLSIDYDQFKQVAMIAQGEFLKLLSASSEERVKIFRNIFNTKIIEEFQIKMKNEKSILKKELDNYSLLLKQQIKILYNDEGINKSEYEWTNISKEKKVLIELERINISNKIEEKNQDEKIKVNLEKKLSIAKIENDNIIKRIEDEKKLEELLSKKDEKIAEKEVIRLQRIVLNTITPLKKEYDNILQKELELEITRKKNQEEIEKNKENLDFYRKENEKYKLLIPKVEESKLKIEKLNLVIDKFKELKKIQSEYLKATKENEIKLEEKGNLEKNINTIKKEKEENEKKLLLMNNNELEKLKIKYIINELENSISNFENIKKINGKIETLNTDIVDLREKFRNIDRKFKKITTELSKMEIDFINEQAGIFAENLEENQPCMVCGSTTHPKKAKLSPNAPTKAEIDSVKDEKEKILVKHNDIVNLGKQKKENLDELKLELSQILEKLNLDSNWAEELEKSEKLKKENIIKYNQIEKDINEAKKYKDIVEKQSNELAEKEEKLQIKIEDFNKYKENELFLMGKVENYKEEVKGFDEYNIYNELEETSKYIINIDKESKAVSEQLLKSENINSSLDGSLSRIKTEIESHKKEKDTALENLNTTIKNNGFEDYEKYIEKEFIIQEKEESNNNFFNDIEKLKEFLERNIEYKNKEITNVEVVEKEIEIIKEKKSEIEKDILNIEKKLTIIESAIKSGDESNKNFIKIQKRYVPVCEISDTINGLISVNGKLTFETFVQGFYFDQVLISANARFNNMSNSRYELFRNESSTDNRKQSGLDMEVADNYTGKRRNVSSLSGGEAFKAALSLALGLSDVIQNFAGGIQIDLMLIDEGFGALDENSRLQAVSVLQNLSDGNRMVGVISHIEEIKDSIDNKIIVNKSTSGSTIHIN